MTALVEVRRRRTWAMLAVTMLTAALVPVLGFVGVRALLDSTGGYDARAANLPIRVFPKTPTSLHLTVDPFGRLAAASVMVLRPGGVGGSVVVLPVNVHTSEVDGSARSLREMFDADGAAAVAAAVESLTLVAIDHVEEQRADQLAGSLLALGPLTVDLAADVPAPEDVAAAAGVETGGAGADLAPDDAPDGAVAFPLPAGRAVLDAATAAAVLASAVDGSLAGHEAHTRNVEAVWVGAALANGAGRDPSVAVDAAPASAAEVRERLFAGQIAVRRLAVGAVDDDAGVDADADAAAAGDDGSGDDPAAETAPVGTPPWPADEVVALDRADAVLVFASVAPASMSGPSPGPLFRMVAPPGYEAEVKRTIEKIQFLGGNVVSVDLSAPEQPGTVFFVPDQVNRDEAEQTNGIFGEFEFIDPDERIEGIDMTVVLGTDYLATALS